MLSCLCAQVSIETMAQPQGHFGYHIVRIIKTSSLGVGSYGAVYRALCDELPCAAKIIHPTLFATHDPGAQKIIERFEQECQFLSGVRHPHIVQYLGVSRDPESQLPVLLMELMDGSLTQFLEQSEEPLPFHIQVDLCHNIALALAYLHSNGIVHRDLSSNNVLLIGPGNRAKVTDFGMSKLADANRHMTPMTMCPGTLAYMPPEALDDPPVYTNKLDCFSFGVLDIQILTRQFPEPSQRFKTIEIHDPRVPDGTVKISVPEAERRQSHIKLISPAHPLLPVALDCLKNRERERPSAQELCHRLAALKEAPQYGESVQQAQRATTDGVQIRELQAKARERQREMEQLQQQHTQQIENLQQEIQEKSNAVEEKNRTIAINESQLKEKDRTIAAKERQLQRKDYAIANMERQLREKDHTITNSERKHQEKDYTTTSPVSLPSSHLKKNESHTPTSGFATSHPANYQSQNSDLKKTKSTSASSKYLPSPPTTSQYHPHFPRTPLSPPSSSNLSRHHSGSEKPSVAPSSSGVSKYHSSFPTSLPPTISRAVRGVASPMLSRKQYLTTRPLPPNPFPSSSSSASTDRKRTNPSTV